jgi:dihydroorotase
MKTLTIKRGKLISPVNGYYSIVKDILIQDGRISAIEDYIEPEGVVIDAEGCVVAPGFIDIHTHCFPDTFLGMDPDILGIQKGSTTILDAGSSGADNYEVFREKYIHQCKTKVFTLLNLSREGLIHGHELDDMAKIDVEKAKEVVSKYPENIVGLKARASASVVGNMGLSPIALAAKTAHELKKPLMVHVGNYPPALTEVLELLDKNDIITHAYHGKPGGILTEENHIIEEAEKARKRGVKFDIGHGSASFSYRVYKQALKENFDCDMISSDLHMENYEGPVFNMGAVASKLINCGESLENAISKSTYVPAAHFGLNGLGELAVGKIADINVMSLKSCNEEVQDSVGEKLILDQKLEFRKTIYSRGNESEIFEHTIRK